MLTPRNHIFKQLNTLAFAAAVLSFLIGLSIVPDHAEAQSNTCYRLQRQLASLGSGNKGSARFRRAAKAQRRQIGSVQSKMNRYGCAAKRRLFAREKHPSCRSLRNTVSKMKRNLRSLESKSGGSNKSASSRKRIKRAMRRHRCGQTDTRQASVKRTSVLEQIFGGSKRKRRRREAERERRELRLERRRERERSSKRNSKRSSKRDSKRSSKRIRSTEDRLHNYNTVRTICVRTCDGYYFPVSFSTNKQSLATDSESCNNLCPGTEMKLYYHKTTGQSTEQMISTADGKPYTSLPNAFAYRTSFNPSCSCNYRLLDRKQEMLPATSAKEQRASDQRTIARIAKPIWRSEKGQDPETLANNKGGLTQQVIVELDPKNTKDKRVAESRRVRIIGDSYFPSQ